MENNTLASNRVEAFSDALALIHNTDIKSFTECLLNNADDYFYEKPASSTGKYHPNYANGEGGLMRHSLAVAFILNDILETECFSFTETERDLLICGAIVHDIKKYGENKNGKTVKNHPELAASYVVDMSKNCNLNKTDIQFLHDIVESHMGKWGKRPPSTDAERVLHIADCLASKKFLNVNFDEIKAQVHSKEINPEDYILTFGKYKGQKLKDTPTHYLRFLVENFKYNNEVKRCAEKLLNND